MSRVRGQKRQLEKARQEKQAEKRERRHARPSATEAVTAEESPEYPQDEVLAELADLHRRFGDGEMALELFEETRDELVRRLRVD